MQRLLKWGCGGLVVLIVCIGIFAIAGGNNDEAASQIGEVESSDEGDEAEAVAADESDGASEAVDEDIPEEETTGDAAVETEDETAEVEEAPVAEASESEDVTAEGPTTFQVGDIVEIEDLVLAVLGWDYIEGDQFNQPDEGQQFIAVEMVLVNQGDDSETLSSFLHMSLRDGTGQKYDPDLLAGSAAGSSAPEGEVSPGERVRGKIGFQVPQDVGALTFVFDASVFGTGKVFVELGVEPVTLEPPTELPGEQVQETHAVGEPVEVGDLTVTVNEVTYPAGDDFNQPKEGNKFVVVDLTLQNRGSEAAAASSILQMELKDGTGQRYDVDLLATTASGGSTPEGELAPGETLRGQVGYQVPADAQDLVFVFDADVFGGGRIQFTIPPQ